MTADATTDVAAWLALGDAPTEPDGFPLRAAHPLAAEHGMLSECMRELLSFGAQREAVLGDTPTGRALLTVAPVRAPRMVLAALERAVWRDTLGPKPYAAGPQSPLCMRTASTAALAALLRRRLPFTAAELARIVVGVCHVPEGFDMLYSVPALVRQVEWHLGSTVLDGELRERVATLRVHFGTRRMPDAPRRTLLARLDVLLAGPGVADAEIAARLALGPPEPWTAEVERWLATLEPTDRARWTRLVAHLLGARTAAPSASWVIEAERLSAAVGDAALRERAVTWRAAAGGGATPVTPRHATLLRALGWLLDAPAGADGDAR